MSARIMDEEKNERDPQDINDHVKVKFDDVIGEPEEIRSPEWVWTTSHECFTCSRNCCYVVMSSLCGWLIAICWGFHFACLSFGHVWCMTPGIRNISINCSALQRCYGHILACCMAPVCDMCSLMFSRITVVQKSG